VLRLCVLNFNFLFMVQCVNRVSLDTWSHECFYDLSNLSPSTKSVRLVRVDPGMVAVVAAVQGGIPTTSASNVF